MYCRDTHSVLCTAAWISGLYTLCLTGTYLKPQLASLFIPKQPLVVAFMINTIVTRGYCGSVTNSDHGFSRDCRLIHGICNGGSPCILKLLSSVLQEKSGCTIAAPCLQYVRKADRSEGDTASKKK